MDNERRGIPVKKVQAEVSPSANAAYMKDQETKLRQAIGEIPADIEGVDVMDGVNIEASEAKEDNNETFTPTGNHNSSETGMSAGA